MPLYEYVCNGCGETTEFLETSAQKEEHVCGDCGGSDLRKAFSAFAAQSSSSSNAGSRASGGSSCSSCRSTACATCRR